MRDSGAFAFDFVGPMLSEGVVSGVFPSAVAAVGCGDLVYKVSTAGTADVDTRFDMASLTKLLSTTMLALLALEEGRLTLTDTLSMYFDTPEDKAELTLYQLLTHTAGLEPFFDLPSLLKDPMDIPAFLMRAPLVAPPDGMVRYSCMGFILLGKILENVYGKPLDVLAKERVFIPLSMANTGYLPMGGNIAPTEIDEGTGIAWCGTVHDENARFLGGVSGNAGVFSDIRDMCRFAAMLARRGDGFLAPATLALATRNMTKGEAQHRGLGFHLGGTRGSFFGDLFPDDSFGHTGFTGTSLVVDPHSGLYVVLLSNRVHPTRENNRHIRFRRVLHNRVFAAYSRFIAEHSDKEEG